MPDLCPNILATGICSDESCTRQHPDDAFACDLCRIFLANQKALLAHNRSKRHLQRTKQRSYLKCVVCDLELGVHAPSAYQFHAQGKRHRRALQAKGLSRDPGPVEAVDPIRMRECDVCQTFVALVQWDMHINGSLHKQRTKFLSLRSFLDEAERNKNGVEVSGDATGVDFGIVAPSSNAAEKRVINVVVTNSGGAPIRCGRMRLSSESRGGRAKAHFSISLPAASQACSIKPAATFTIPLTFSALGQRGRFQDRIEFYFIDDSLREEFAITRALHATVGDRADYELLKATAPFVRRKRSDYKPIKEEDVTRGVPPEALTSTPWKTKLEKYDIPPRLIEIAFGTGTDGEISKRIKEAFLPKVLDKSTYGRHYQVLLWIEEERARRDLSQYDMESETLSAVAGGRFYELAVMGLAEKRPSVIVSDRIYVRESGAISGRWFEGYVHRVLESSVYLQFNRSFKSITGLKYNIRFSLNRTTLRRMHHALCAVFKPSHILFPSVSDISGLSKPTAARTSAIRPVDRKIATNPPQLQAVAAVLHRPVGSVPLVIFGPPGTGKTVTMVESIRQVLLGHPDARVLACAPSNSAADLFAERLHDLGKATVFRLNAVSRTSKHVPLKVKELSRLNGELFTVPPVEELKQFRVVISTCFSASVPSGIGIARGHFTHIFVDEAGQATEPEVMIPIKTMADQETIVVLAGDVKQLGPIVRSPIARQLGLAVSYLDRLLATPIYDEDEGRGTTLVKLTKNWRSHPAILKFPNEEFYRNELEACGDPAVTHSLLRWDKLPKRNFPILFHGIAGKDEREASSPSFFNIDEASLVKQYVQDLLGESGFRLTPQHIGIISPYRAQVGKVRMALPKTAREIKVGSVEEFQGQERRAIILSTVRSAVDMVEFDLKHTLGFVANPRRFNVSITRAQAVLIIVGNPNVLALDPLWKCFINYVHANGGYKGVPFDWDPSEPVDRSGGDINQKKQNAESELEALIARTRKRILNETEDLTGRNEDDEIDANVDRPWREDE